jgi:glutathione S-transferase
MKIGLPLRAPRKSPLTDATVLVQPLTFLIVQAEIALAHAKADFKRFEIDLQNKPDWYAPKVNPASKVPAIAYGGPDVAPDQPSLESTKIAESL